jgi:hypothetical protein
MTDIG